MVEDVAEGGHRLLHETLHGLHRMKKVDAALWLVARILGATTIFAAAFVTGVHPAVEVQPATKPEHVLSQRLNLCLAKANVEDVDAVS